VGYRTDLQNLRTSHTSPKVELTKQLSLKDRRKTDETPQIPGKTKREPLHKYQHQDWIVKE
jgi:hypothetical protein